MIDFGKIYCKAHPCELINNFCSDSRLYIIKKIASLDCAPLASATTLKCTCKIKHNLNSKTLGTLFQESMKRFNNKLMWLLRIRRDWYTY